MPQFITKILRIQLPSGPALAHFRQERGRWTCYRADERIHYLEIMTPESIKELLTRNDWPYSWHAGPEEVRNPSVPSRV